MQSLTENNETLFLLDEEFFQQVHQQLSRIERSEPADDTYVAIAMWSCDLETPLPKVEVPGGEDQEARKLEEVLSALGDKGHKVKIVLWAGSSVSGVTGNKERLKALKAQKWAASNPNIRVYLEPYKSSMSLGISFFGWGASNHQKMVICSHQGKLEAIIGGFNLGGEYSSKANHSLAGQYWHDTAVVLKGPAAADVHNEWVRRWSKQGTGQGVVANVKPSTQKSKAKQKITIATTNSEFSARQNDIRQLMVDHIKAARTSIYIENYAFTDPALLEALWSKLATSNIPVVVLINHPQNELFEANTTWSYYHYYAYVHLSLARATEVVVDSPTNLDALPHPLPSSGEWTLVPGKGRGKVTFLEPQDSELSWTDDEGDMWSCHFSQIRSITAPPILYGVRSSNTRTNSKTNKTYRCWPYPHSKMAIFDDKVAVIGSSNWTYRSMEYDGEIAAFIDCGTAVPALRKRLLSHWWLDGVGNKGLVDSVPSWIAQAPKNEANIGKTPLTQPLPRCYVMPLHFDDFLHPDEAARLPGTRLTSMRTNLDLAWKMF